MLIMIYPLQNDNPYKIPTNTILQYKRYMYVITTGREIIYLFNNFIAVYKHAFQ